MQRNKTKEFSCGLSASNYIKSPIIDFDEATHHHL